MGHQRALLEGAPAPPACTTLLHDRRLGHPTVCHFAVRRESRIRTNRCPGFIRGHGIRQRTGRDAVPDFPGGNLVMRGKPGSIGCELTPPT